MRMTQKHSASSSTVTTAQGLETVKEKLKLLLEYAAVVSYSGMVAIYLMSVLYATGVAK